MSNERNDTAIGMCPYCLESRALFLRPYDTDIMIGKYMYLCRECMMQEEAIDSVVEIADKALEELGE